MFLFYGPDQRSVFLGMLFGVCLYPTKRFLRYMIAVCLMVATLFVQQKNLAYFKLSNKLIGPMVKLIEQIPAQKKVLPVVFEPFSGNYCSHRIFEYYHIKQGGQNPYQFCSSTNFVRYRTVPPDIDIFAPVDPETYPVSLLKKFDVILVIGYRALPEVTRFLSYGQNAGFTRFCVSSDTVNALTK